MIFFILDFLCVESVCLRNSDIGVVVVFVCSVSFVRVFFVVAPCSWFCLLGLFFVCAPCFRSLFLILFLVLSSWLLF